MSSDCSLDASPKQFSNELPTVNASGTLTLADLEKLLEIMRDEPVLTPDPREFKHLYCPDSTFLDE